MEDRVTEALRAYNAVPRATAVQRYVRKRKHGTNAVGFHDADGRSVARVLGGKLLALSLGSYPTSRNPQRNKIRKIWKRAPKPIYK
eukprot:3235750-Amphidinium_carterae.1